MNKKEKQQLLPTIFSNTNGCNIGFHQHLMISVTTIVVLQQTELSGFSQTLVCKTEIDNERFEINVLHEDVPAGIQFKFKFIRQAVEQFSGWKVGLYKMSGSIAGNGKMIIDRGKKHLYVDVDLLRMPLRR